MSEMTTVTVERATSSHRAVLADALAAAFQNDPVLGWVVRSAGDRRARLPAVFEAFVDVYLPHGESYLAGDGIGGALWAPPGCEPFTADVLDGFVAAMSEALGEDAERAFLLDESLDDHHPGRPCAYLQFMGVHPAFQGQGVGSSLLDLVLRRCDVDGTSAYLEATSVDNRRLYERHGFEVVTQIDVPEGPRLWSMWRDPAT